MKLGFGTELTEGSKYLRFCTEDSRTLAKEELFGVIKAVAIAYWNGNLLMKREALDEFSLKN
jgi:hypothetical protein